MQVQWWGIRSGVDELKQCAVFLDAGIITSPPTVHANDNFRDLVPLCEFDHVATGKIEFSGAVQLDTDNGEICRYPSWVVHNEVSTIPQRYKFR